jgi:putative chitinase
MADAFDRKVYFDSVRAELFHGAMSQRQVEGQEAILGEWELQGQAPGPPMTDLRFLAYMLATTYHETSQEMWPIEEYGKGAGQEYGEIDPETGQAYYGRGFVQLTWRENYKKATVELGLKEGADLEWHPEMALDPQIAADIMFIGMREGWFRQSSDGRPQTLVRYFNQEVDDPYNAREIINGDKKKVPSWSDGVSVGNLIAGYHDGFFDALQASVTTVADVPTIEIVTTGLVRVIINGVIVGETR